MKRNLSSKAIKAMAIGMAVTLGSTTAISGVIGGSSVVTVKATSKIDDTTAPESITNTDFTTALKNTDYVITNSGLVFQVTDIGTVGNGTDFTSGTAGTAKLIKKGTVHSNTPDGTEGKEYGASLENGVLMVKADNANNSTGKVYKLKVTELGNGTDAIAPDLSDVNVSALISENLEKIHNKAFAGTIISENLNIDTSKITSGTFTIGGKVLEGATINGNLTIGGSKQATPSSADGIFKNLIVNGNLDLSNLQISLVSNLSTLGLGARDDEVECGNRGVVVKGEF